MKGYENKIRSFMSGGGRYLIPCYQRQYSWKEKQCRDLFDDMVRLHYQQREHDPEATHFIGSIVMQSLPDAPSSIMVIDGQQRLTTMYLFYLALYRLALMQADDQAKRKYSSGSDDAISYDDNLAPKIKIKILDDDTDGVSCKHRFTLTEADQDALDKLFAGNEDEFVADSLLTRNYRLFLKWISAQEDMSLNDFYKVTASVAFIAIDLDAKDDAQLIFESLNSKGLKLSEGDKVRNFLLMGFGTEEVKTHYRELWRPIELNCGDAISGFIKYFLDIKDINNEKKPSKRSLYVNFKDYVQGLQPVSSSATNKNQVSISVLEELLAYSKLFARMRSCSYSLYSEHDTQLSSYERSQLQKALTRSLFHLQQLPYSVQSPVVLQALMLHAKKQISGTELLEALQLLESFLFRRWACGCPSQGLNREFQSIASKLVPDANGVCAVMLQLKQSLCSENKMPSDAAFVQALQQRALYKNSKSNPPLQYMFDRMERADNREYPDIDDSYSIEHIMPQKLTAEWRAELGADADAIHKKWLHRLGNLTLTAYNSKYSNSSFAEKCNMEHGFKHSSLRLNRDIAEYTHWGQQEMAQRTEALVAKALNVWPYPSDCVGNRTVFEASHKAEPESFDYCLADGECNLTGTKLRGYEFMGQHYEAKRWAKLQRDLMALIYKSNPERLSSWFKAPWGRFNVLEQYLKSSPDFPIVKDSPKSVYQIDDQLYYSTNQDVGVKIKILQQLFELMQIDPAQLTLHLVRSKG